ncbi:E3 ubiquitin-protein ligase Topors-like [Neocloeon triangulifer]|uniref:E3 ubiquitin-protein ligase Topors-like n=1 Tax=Neocloeon triangulifer TaxID=2078957 RepID=UPI00286EBC01|nr:E3 ubiquitin-protein ligase Topors-like [Neocloeon triangulifer]
MECPPTPPLLPAERIPTPEEKVTKGEDLYAPRSGSPEPNCTICLGPLTNRSNTDICAHKFCFECIHTWSKVKSECPLCKQKFSMIYHGYKEDGSHKVFTVPRPAPDPSVDSELHGNYFMVVNMPNLPEMPIMPMPFMRRNLNRHRLPHLPSMYARLRRAIPRPTALSVTPEESLPLAMRTRSHSRLVNSYQYRPVSNPSEIPSPMGIDRRCQIYALNQWALPLPDITGRTRESSLAFFLENPALTHRLTSWILRDLSVLLSEPHIAQASHRISEMLLQHDLTSREFSNEVRTFLGDRTRHFMHELISFARSPYDMMAYDRYVSYGNWHPNFHSYALQPNGENDSEDLDDEDVVEVPVDGGTARRFEYPSMRERLNFYRQRDPDRWDRIYARLRSIQDYSTRANELLNLQMPSESSAFTAFSAAPAPQVQIPPSAVAGPSGLSVPLTTVQTPIVLDSSDDEALPASVETPAEGDFLPSDNEVEVVGVFKPRRIRTPELIEITSDQEELPEFFEAPLYSANTLEVQSQPEEEVETKIEVEVPRPPSPPPLPEEQPEEKKIKKLKRHASSPRPSKSRSKHKKHRRRHHSTVSRDEDVSSSDEFDALMYKPPKIEVNMYSSSEDDEEAMPARLRSVIVASSDFGGASTSRSFR